METVDTLDNVPLKLIAGQFGLWGQSIPGSLYRDEQMEWGEWRIVEVTGAHMGDREGVLVMVSNSEGDCFEGFSPVGDFMLVAACCNALEEAQAHYSFDGVCDLIEEKKHRGLR